MTRPLSAKDKTLIAVGAAIAAGCRPCLERTVSLARQAGACERSIRLAIEIALASRARQLASLSEWAEQVQGSKPEVDESYWHERAPLAHLVRCGAALGLRDAESLPERVAEATAAGADERRLASALAIARSVAATAQRVAEEAVHGLVPAEPERSAGGCACEC